MAAKFPKVYQFKITLKRISPKIWRRIQVPENYSFFELHVAIISAMGWGGYHLHQFEIYNPKFCEVDVISSPDPHDSVYSDPVIHEEKAKISKYFSLSNNKANYEYDFGDGWEHEIILEKILPAIDGMTYPICIDGKRACPPEDCGGVWGYQELLQIIKDPSHEEYEERMEWLCRTFDPEEFDPESVMFGDPEEY